MYSAIERLESLRVADVMTRNVVRVRTRQPMSEVAALFRWHDVSAAPVVDEQGHCVGILSATDFLERDAACGDGRAPGSQRCSCRLSGAAADQPLHVISPVEDAVSDWMTDAVQSVSPQASLAMAAKIMCARHVHRLVVLDARQRVCGVVSTMDIAAALVNALDELHTASSYVGV
jgi:CBS-domain-containing membrane protein